MSGRKRKPVEVLIAEGKTHLMSILKLIRRLFLDRNRSRELFADRISQIKPRINLKISFWLRRGLCPPSPGIYRLLFSQG